MQTKVLKILVIDDNKNNLTALKEIISQVLPNTKIFTALNSKKSIEIAKTNNPDVILLDIEISSFDSIKLCKMLKADENLTIIPVIFLTDLHTGPQMHIKAMEAGGETFLSKPIDPMILMTQIKIMIKIKACNLQLEDIVIQRTHNIEQELFMLRKIEKELLLACQRMKKTQEEKSFIIDCQKQLLELNDINKTYCFVGEKIKELIGNGYTVISRLNEKIEAMNIISYYGFENKIRDTLKIFGKDPRKMNFYIKDISKEQIKLFRNGRLEKFDLYILLNKIIPKSVCKLAEKYLKVNYIYGMGFVSFGQHIGGLTILSDRDLSDLKDTIEIFVNQAALTILRIQSEEQLKKSEGRYRSIFDQSPFGIAVVNSKTRVIYNVNQKFADIIGRTIDECTNLDWLTITHPDDMQEDLDNMDLFNAGIVNSYNMNKRYIKPDDSIVWINMTIAPIKVIGENPCHICMIEDITEKKEKEEKINYLNYHDVLTGLHNRTYFEEQVRHFQDKLPLSVIVGDINGLKIINDSLGHAGGDKLLVILADILKCIRRKNDIIARTGGDEFAILLPHTNCEETQSIIECIYAKCKEYENEINKDLLFLSISLGAATKTEEYESFDCIIKKAEDNMYRRKLLEHKSFHNSIISSIRTTLFEKSHETEEHAARLIALSLKLGKSLGLKEEQLSELALLSTLHDIGKISIDDKILTKTGKLTEKEWDEIKKHPAIGYRIAMASPELAHISDYILCHHERWDGNGYPQGISGENIPLLSRILSVIDAYDAMTNDRSYRKGMSVEDAIIEIEKNAGTQFDPDIAELFIKIIKEESDSIVYAT